MSDRERSFSQGAEAARADCRPHARAGGRPVPGGAATPPGPPRHSYVAALTFTGGIFSGETVSFSPGLNTLIGIRGGGKSALLETLRTVLELPLGGGAEAPSDDRLYKENLVRFAMGGGGGKVTAEIVDRSGQHWTLERVLGEDRARVLLDGKEQPPLTIRESVIRHPVYFGQKDLSRRAADLGGTIAERLAGPRLDDVRRRARRQRRAVEEAFAALSGADGGAAQLEAFRREEADVRRRLGAYAGSGIEGRMRRQLEFAADERAVGRAREWIRDLADALSSAAGGCGEGPPGREGLRASGELAGRFAALRGRLADGLSALRGLRGALAGDCAAEAEAIAGELERLRRGSAEEFAAASRDAAERLKAAGAVPGGDFGPDAFLRDTRRLAALRQSISMLEKAGGERALRENVLREERAKLSRLWREECDALREAVGGPLGEGAAVGVACELHGDRAAFLAKLKEAVEGTGARDAALSALAGRYTDFWALREDFENAKKMFGADPGDVAAAFAGRWKELLTYRVPDKITLTYRGEPLERLSIGQRASALLLFVLNQRDRDLFIIDQPEDDLDNRTLYRDVIRLIRARKPEAQFIFATHNPNIPVLGDAERVLVCRFERGRASVAAGGVDDGEIRNGIVEIMEGGRQAFESRERIYRSWSLRNS